MVSWIQDICWSAYSSSDYFPDTLRCHQSPEEVSTGPCSSININLQPEGEFALHVFVYCHSLISFGLMFWFVYFYHSHNIICSTTAFRYEAFNSAWDPRCTTYLTILTATLQQSIEMYQLIGWVMIWLTCLWPFNEYYNSNSKSKMFLLKSNIFGGNPDIVLFLWRHLKICCYCTLTAFVWPLLINAYSSYQCINAGQLHIQVMFAFCFI